MVKSGSFDIDAPLPSPCTAPALILAADRGLTELVELLLNAGARVDATDESRRTACHVAARNNHKNVVAALIAHHANLELKDECGQTAFDVSIARGSHGITAMLLSAGQLLASDDRRCPEIAAMSTEIIKEMLKRGFVVNRMREENGLSPLHFASVGEFRPDVLDMLVNVCGCDLNARDYSGKTCAHLSAMSGKDQQLRWLIEAGADLVANADDHSPLHDACSNDNDRCVLLILAAGGDVHLRNTRGRTAAQLATISFKGISNDTLSIVHLLLAAGASIDDPNRQSGVTVRQCLAKHELFVDVEQIEMARRRIEKERLDFVRHRALQVCVGLQSRGLDALVMCEILQNACGPVAPQISFHHWWKIATTVKHSKFQQSQ